MVVFKKQKKLAKIGEDGLITDKNGANVQGIDSQYNFYQNDNNLNMSDNSYGDVKRRYEQVQGNTAPVSRGGYQTQPYSNVEN